MNRLRVFFCTRCGNVTLTYGNAAVGCCGVDLQPVECEQPTTLPTVAEVDGEYLLEYGCPMTKDDYIAAVVVERYDRVELIRLFPEQEAVVRIAQLSGAKIYTLYRRGERVWFEEYKD